MPSDDNGVAALRQKRANRITRKPPPPRHPRPVDLTPPDHESVDTESVDHGPTESEIAASAQATEEPREVPGDVSPAISHEISPDQAPSQMASTSAAVTQRPSAQPRREPEKTVTPRRRRSATMPALNVDPTDPAMRAIAPNVLSVAASVMERFRAVRRNGPTHTALVLTAIRQHAGELPQLVQARRPTAPGRSDLFPWRSQPGVSVGERKEHLRIRPLAGEWQVITQLARWVNDELGSQLGAAEVTRSEVVEAALDRYLPKL